MWKILFCYVNNFWESHLCICFNEIHRHFPPLQSFTFSHKFMCFLFKPMKSTLWCKHMCGHGTIKRSMGRLSVVASLENTDSHSPKSYQLHKPLLLPSSHIRISNWFDLVYISYHSHGCCELIIKDLISLGKNISTGVHYQGSYNFFHPPFNNNP